MVKNLNDAWRNAQNNHLNAISTARDICQAAVAVANSEEDMEAAFRVFDAAIEAAKMELKRQYGYN